MPNIRFTLWLILGAVLYYNYLAWQQDYRPLPQLTGATSGGTHGSLGNSLPTPEGLVDRNCCKVPGIPFVSIYLRGVRHVRGFRGRSGVLITAIPETVSCLSTFDSYTRFARGFFCSRM